MYQLLFTPAELSLLAYTLATLAYKESPSPHFSQNGGFQILKASMVARMVARHLIPHSLTLGFSKPAKKKYDGTRTIEYGRNDRVVPLKS